MNARSAPVPRPVGGSTWVTLAAVGLTTAVTVESFRVLFPSAYGLADRSGNEAAAGLALMVGLSPLLVPLVRRVLGHRRAAVGAVLALAAWRLTVQVVGDTPLVLAAVGTVLGFMAVTLVLTAPLPGGGDTKGIGVLAGLAFDAGLLAAFATWDPVWQDGALARATGAALAVTLAVAALVAARHWAESAADPVGPTMSGGVAVAAVIALEHLFLVNPGYLAAAVGTSLAWATGTAVVGAMVALAAHTVVGRGGGAPTLACGAVLAAAGFVLPTATGATVVAVVVAAQLAIGAVLARALAPARVDHEARAEVGFALGWLGLMVATLLFQLHYDQPLPVSNRFVTAALGLLAAVAALGDHTREPGLFPVRPALTLGVVALGVAIAVPVGLGLTAVEEPVAAEAVTTLRVAQWNVRQGVDGDGRLDPSAIAAALERQGPLDLVVLNEVGRGWPLSGQLDLATWLSRRLDLPYVWGGAASRQFGNLVLSRLPITASTVTALPVDGDAQGRSFITVRFDIEGRTYTLLATHLQHRNSPSARAVRLAEIEVLLGEWGGEARTLVVGDLNPAQGDPPDYAPRVPYTFAEIEAFLDAGFTTAADLSTCAQPTSGRNCSDYLLVSHDLVPTSLVVVPVDGSDHRLLVGEISLG